MSQNRSKRATLFSPQTPRAVFLACAMTVLAGSIMSQAQETREPDTAETQVAVLPPVSTKKQIGSWVVECLEFTPKKSAKGTGPIPKPGSIPDFIFPRQKSCQAVQTFKNKNSGNEFARIAMTPDPKRKNRTIIGIRTPVDVSFDVPLRINITKKRTLDGRFKRCVKLHCFAFLNPTSKQLTALLKAKEPSLQFPISDGRSIRFPFSTDGLKSALDAVKTNSKI